MASFSVNTRLIGEDQPCYVIAEIGHNHQGRYDIACQMIHAAAEAGAHAVKFQKRANRTLYTKAEFDRPYPGEHSHGATYGLHREALEFNTAQYCGLFEEASAAKIACFATAFDEASADSLADWGVPAFKIASADLRNLPLLRHVAQFHRPMFVSTGAALLHDIRRAAEVILPINADLCLLHCTAIYPVEDHALLNLTMIQTLRREFPDCVIGYSGHDAGIVMPIVAYVLGARVIEKHFTLNRAWHGTDQGWSVEPAGLRRIVRDLERTRQALGDGVKRFYPEEIKALIKMGKSLVITRPLAAGHVLEAADVTWKSPGGGFPPSCLNEMIGAVVGANLEEEQILRLRLTPSTKETGDAD